MTSDFVITGGDQFARLSDTLREAGHTGLRKELKKGLKDAVKPLVKATRAEARQRLPKRGGLAALVARTPQTVQIRTGATTSGVRLTVPKTKSGAAGANAGVIRHRVFGSNTWVEQKVPPGWFDEPMAAGAPTVRPGLEQAMQRVADQVTDG